MQNQEQEQEIARLTAEVAAQPTAALYTQRGKLLASLKRYDEAITDYSRAIELDPNHTRAYTGRANAYTATGRFMEALADVNKVL